jgi:endonuclease YncB( thermonuclease family)
MNFIRSITAATLVMAAFSLNAQTITGKVVSVADGDTITVLDSERTQHKIRLAGIDAPERKQPFGQRAREHLSSMVAGRVVSVPAEKQDRYGRTVGVVLVEGRDANLAMITAGLAWHYKKYEQEQSPSDRQLYAEAEVKAKSARLGLWSDAPPIAPWDWRAGFR